MFIQFAGDLCERRFTRRGALAAGVALALGTSACAKRGARDLGAGAYGAWTVPPEHDRHAGCWMAWPARDDVWGDRLADVRADIARVAATIAVFEPVSVLCRPGQLATARDALPAGIRVVPGAVDDCWVRDSGPVFVRGPARAVAAVDLNFNGWGARQVSAADASVAGQIARHAGVRLRRAGLVAEGGALGFDGDGTVMLTAPSPLSLFDSQDVCPCAINFYVANGAVVMPRFEDETTNLRARAVIARACPGRQVVAVPIPALADGGGGIHCVTQQQPAGPPG